MNKDQSQVMELLTIGRLPQRVQTEFFANQFAAAYQQLYRAVLDQALSEFPAIDGYETMHALLCERMAMTFVHMKVADGTPEEAVAWKNYNTDFKMFLKTCEGLLKEARTLASQKSLVLWKHKFVHDLVGVIDKTLSDQNDKTRLKEGLLKLVQQ